ncbi:MAG: MmgE/PrpD family protein [Deltaproteobacteria bacterium]|nr:MmgE/PrpD family protein [Deltaproteobacteria bacterium]MBW1994318.1 MmgE/PrpD family protein [Deltaproteobacteria bacterium]MBW2152587.1 MmgE/PrpD family protein [Deltaproteobacteria bacterium]
MNKALKKSGSITERIVHFLKHLSFDELPADVVSQAKLVVLDTLGAMLAATKPKYSAGRILAELVRDLGGSQESTIIGQNFKSSCLNATLVNGTLGYYCDIETHHPEAVVHPAATIVPTCLAMGEREKVDGKRFLMAFVLGTDIDCRVSLALNPRVLYDRGFHPSSIAGTIGAAAAAGRILELDLKQFPIALGLATQQTSGLLAWKEDFTENSRPFNHSIAARGGVTSALLAKRGFGGPADIFEGIYDIFRAYSKEDECDPEQLTRDLGVKFSILELAFKKYSCCAFLHPGLDALFKIMEDHGLKSTDIEGIVLRFAKNGTELIDGTELRSHSAQYILPVGAVTGKVTIDDIIYDRRSEPEINRLIARTWVVGDEELDAGYPERYSSIVEITTVDGTVFSHRVDHAAGTPQNPFGPADIEKKFYELSGEIVDQAVSDRIVEMVHRMEQIEDINTLGSLLQLKE